MNTTQSETSRTDDDRVRTDFGGYDRGNGDIGVRNRVLVLPSVICSHMVADRIADRVAGAESTPHDHGCAQIGADNDQTERTFLGVASNPNVAGTLVVGLGCEHVQSDDVAAKLEAMGEDVCEMSIQDEGGTDPTIEHGIETARRLVDSSQSDRTSADFSDLTVGIVSSDLHEETIAEADPLVGAFVDEVVDAGGRVVAAGAERLIANADAAREVAADDSVRAAVEELLARHGDIPSKKTGIRRMAESRSFADGTRAWSDQPVRDVIDYGERATHDTGLAVVDAPSQFAEAATALTAAGAQIILHVTDDGVPTGHPIAPVVKLTGNSVTYRALGNDITLDATTASLSDLRDYVRDVLNGRETCSERHGLKDFAITRVGPSM